MNIFKYILSLSIIVSILVAGTDGTIRGKVTDSDGSALIGTQIYMPELGKGTTADIDGNFIILNIPVGEYEICLLYTSPSPRD